MQSLSAFEIFVQIIIQFTPVWVALAIVMGASWYWQKRLGLYGKLYGSKIGVIGLFIVLFWVFTSILADYVALFDPLEQIVRLKRKPPGIIDPSSGYPFLLGGDNLGRDLFSRMVYGSRFVLFIAPTATLVAFIVGILLGLPAGYYGKKTDNILSFIANLVLSFPVILLFYLLVTPGIRETALPNIFAGLFFLFPVIFISILFITRYYMRIKLMVAQLLITFLIGIWAYVGLVFDADPLGILSLDPNELNIFVAVVFASSPGVFRIVRGLTLDVATRDYIAAAQTRGENAWYVMMWEILPNARGPLIVDGCLRIGYTTILLGTLGFFGLGLAPESPDWGSMINQTRGFIRLIPTMVLPQTIALASLVLGLNMLADGLREQSLKD